MTKNTEQLEVLEDLLNRARSGIHSDFVLLTCWSDLTAARTYRKAVDNVTKGFIAASRNTYAAYLDTIENGEDGLDLLISYKELQPVIQYYLEESEICSDVLDEYKCYVLSGHLLDFLLNTPRPEEDLVDYRTFLRGNNNDK